MASRGADGELSPANRPLWNNCECPRSAAATTDESPRHWQSALTSVLMSTAVLIATGAQSTARPTGFACENGRGSSRIAQIIAQVAVRVERRVLNKAWPSAPSS
jgi:hypothetical protein